MNKPANVARTEAFKAINDNFRRYVEDYPDVRKIPASGGYYFSEMIRDLYPLSTSGRWNVAVSQWALFVEDNAEDAHWAFVQGMIGFIQRTAGLLNDE